MTRAAPAVACALASCIAQPDPPAPCSVYRPDGVNSDYVDVEPWRSQPRRAVYTESDLHLREFLRDTSRKHQSRVSRVRAA